ncbi:MAG: hypothetical protein JSV63_01865 [Candidatus Aenigmatarchaeota archaeon]|nr:MAG: hypothetical protein JSV63_01865 [Candidatus Aenigmarchaeota archaeon]
MTEVTPKSLVHFFVDDSSIGGWGLNNGGEDINLSNGSYSSLMSYSSSSSGMTWSLCNGTWTEKDPTPGEDNMCGYVQPANESNETVDFGEFALSVYGPSSSVRFGDFANVKAVIHTGNEGVPLRVVAYVYSPRWISNDLEGNTIRIGLNETDTALILDARKGHNVTLLLPVFLKSNCDGDYSAGVYTGRVRIYEDLTGGVIDEEKFNITLSGINSLFCADAQDCPSCPKCKKTRCSYPSPATGPAQTEDETEFMELLSASDSAEIGVPFETVVRIENIEDVSKAVSVYSYAYEGSRCISLGFDGEEWKHGWTANSHSLELSPGESLNLTLENKIQEGTSPGIYSFRVRLKEGEKKTDITRTINVTPAPEVPEEKGDEFAVTIIPDEDEEEVPVTGMATSIDTAQKSDHEGLLDAFISWILSIFKF